MVTAQIVQSGPVLQEIMMDHALRSISYIADIGELVVIMARRRILPQDTGEEAQVIGATPKMICHVFESEEVGSASKSSIRRFVITKKAPNRAFSWLKAAITAFTFKTLLRHYAKRALTPRSLNVKLGPRRNYYEGRAAIRHSVLIVSEV